MNKPAFQLKSARFSYRGLPILNDVHLRIASGEFIGVFGPNGGGKTTLLKLLLGFLSPESGSVEAFGETPKRTRHRIGYVPQVHRTDPDFPISVSELIALGRLSERPYGGGFSREDRDKALFWMDKLELTRHKDKAYGELSGGLAQRALLARALIADPDALLLDEPTAHIDAHSLNLFLKTLDELRGRKTILLVTHDLKTVVQKVDRLLCVQNKVASLKPTEICEHFALGLYHTPLQVQTNHFAEALR